MKKTYQKPNLREIKMETVGIIAGSGPQRSKTYGSLDGITFTGGTSSQQSLDYEW